MFNYIWEFLNHETELGMKMFPFFPFTYPHFIALMMLGLETDILNSGLSHILGLWIILCVQL